MKTITISLLATLAVLVSGCEWMKLHQADSATDIWAVTSANDQAVRDALIRQSAIYPYHFIDNGAYLNPLGASDLATLISHFKKYPGCLSIRRGAETETVYLARVQEVLKAMTTGGVDVSRTTVVDLPAGGDGMPAENVIDILKLTKPVAFDLDVDV